MDTLWAPWRSGYVMDAKPQGCIFCDKPREDRDEANYILHRGTHCFVMLNAYPYNNGHLMVIPYTHSGDIAELNPAASAEMIILAQHSVTILRDRLHSGGFNLGMNLGSAAGAGIADHVHLHVVPRWIGDSNFMTVVGDTRVLPQSLADSYTLLAGGFDALIVQHHMAHAPDRPSGQGSSQ